MKIDDKKEFPKRRKPASGVHINIGKPTVVFLTVCTRNRMPWLTQNTAVATVINAWKEARSWQVGYYLFMPDHVHLFCAPMDLNFTLDQWVTYWKRLCSRSVTDERWRWQSHKWDTRLRCGENYHEKWEYVRHNPVRKGLVAKPEDWLFQGILTELRWR